MRLSTTIHAPAINTTGLHRLFVNPGELEVICHLVNRIGAASFLEIGTNSGRTSLAVLRNCPTVKVAWGIDVPPTYQFEKQVQQREAPVRPGEVGLTDPRYRCLLVRQGTFDIQPDELPRFDAIFVDADHSERGVRNDYRLAKQLLRPASHCVVIFHDDNGLPVVDVTRTLDALAAEGSNIVHINNTWLAFEEFK